MDNVSVLNKLENLQQLLEENHALRSYIDGGCARETVDQLEEIREKIGTLPQAPSVASCRVTFPLPADHATQAKAEKSKRKILFFATAAVAALLLIIYFASNNDALNFLCVLGIFATIAVGWFYKMSCNSYKTKDKELQDSRKNYASSLDAFRTAMSCYEKEVAEGRNEYDQYLLRYYQYYPDFLDTLTGYEKKTIEAENALEENERLIAECDVAAPEYFHLVPKVISMLKTGRADSYKEALNIAIEEERQEAIEAARREEEARRLAALERQAEEERRHNMMLEQQQREHDRAMERAAQDQAAEQRRANQQAERDRQRAESEARRRQMAAESEARKQANATRMAGVSKCAACKNNKHCPSHVKNNGSGLTCGAYQPY